MKNIVLVKKFVSAVLTVFIISGTAAASNIKVSVNSGTKQVDAVVDIGRTEKAVPAAAAVTDSLGSVDYISEGYTDENGKWHFGYIPEKTGRFGVKAYADGECIDSSFLVPDIITAEAENIKRQTFTPAVFTDKVLSGGAMIGCGVKQDTSKKYYLEYELEAANEGMYELHLRTTPLGERWSTDYSFRINGGEYIKPSEYALKSRDFTEYRNNPGLLKEYSLGRVYLNRGVNKLGILLDADDATEEGNYIFYADCFWFEQQDYEFDRIRTNDAAGAYEQGNDVVISIDFKACASRSEEYGYTVTDFWNNVTETKTASISAGESSISVNLGKYGCGWYRFKLYKNGAEVSEATFSVVPPYGTRYSGETPFAADFDSAQLVNTNEKRRKMAKAAKLAGIQWVRERTSQRGLQADENSEPYYKYVNRLADVMHENGLKVISVLYNLADGTDLTEVYNRQRELAANTDIDMWEIENETDSKPAEGTADGYAAFYKAAALGNADAQTGTGISMSSQCMDAAAPYNTLLMKNDLLAFSDIYNFHTHTVLRNGELPVINSSATEKHYKTAFENGSRPFWITEAGLYIQTDANAEINDEQRAEQARYNVVSTVQSLASGTEKHFWFILPQFIENGREMGTFDKDMNPNPSYQSQAVMTNVLGRAEIKGRLETDGAEGYLFDSENGDVAVIWAQSDMTVNLSASSAVRITDIMGRETTAEPSGGSVAVNIGKYPVYISYNGAAEGYAPLCYEKGSTASRGYSAAERIVIRQDFGEDGAVQVRGAYSIEKGKTQSVSLELYNFNNEEKSIRLSGSLYGYEVIPENADIVIPAMQCVKTSAELRPVGNAPEDVRLSLIFSCTADGEVSSPAAAYVVVSDTSKQPDITMSGYDSAGNWLNYPESGCSTVLTDTENGVHFEVNTTAANRTYYAMLATNRSESTGTDGISFTATADTGCEKTGMYNVFCWMNDGRVYYLGGNSGIMLSEKTVRVNCGWDEFVLVSSPLGDADTRKIDPEKIRHISFGGQFYRDKVGYTLKYMGYFVRQEENGVSVLSAWAGNSIAKAQLIGSSGNADKCMLIAAVYDGNGSLMRLYKRETENGQAFMPYDVSIKGDMRGECVRLFVWNGFSGLVPLAGVSSLKRE